MSIVKTLSLYEFQDEFLHSDRSDSFTHTALEALYDYYYNLCDPDNYELNIVEICCEWTEYNSTIEAANDLGGNFDYETSTEEEILEYLKEHVHMIILLLNDHVLVSIM